MLLSSSTATAASAPTQVDIPEPRLPLRRLPVLASEDGLLSANFALTAVRLRSPNISLTTRAFNGAVPGLMLAVRPGDTLRVRYENRLEGPLGPEEPKGPKLGVDTYHHPNDTNLHVHGLHVSSMPPSDDVLDVLLRPGEAWQYEYHIQADHSPGTYWVHPHSHGSAVQQTGAGAAAPLLVLDPPGYLSEQLAALEDETLMLQGLSKKNLVKAAGISQDKLLRIERWNWQPELWLVNGAPEPVLRVQSGTWRRLRLIMAGVSSWFLLDFESCEVALLAKDGVYIDDFPRFVRLVTLPPGGRADLVVRCSAGVGGEARRHSVRSLPAQNSGGLKTFQGTVFWIEAAGAAAGAEALASAPLQPWRPASRPRYLEDLRAQVADCSCNTSLGLGGNTRWMEGHIWEGKRQYLHRSPEDAVIERNLSGLNKHPYHAHTFPFQLLTTPGGDDPYFKAGDWHDTYQNVVDSEAVVRFHTVDFAGPQLVHCHVLGHSDTGMLAVELVQGRGAGACGCDLLDAEEAPVGLAVEVGEFRGWALLLPAEALFTGMLVVTVGVAVHAARSWRSAVAASYYEALASGPRLQQPEGIGA